MLEMQEIPISARRNRTERQEKKQLQAVHMHERERFAAEPAADAMTMHRETHG
jgi:hypothetical protein